MAEKGDQTTYKYDVTVRSGPFREPDAPALSYDYYINRKGWLIPRVMRVWVDIKSELEFFQHQILGVSGGSPGQQLKLTQFLTLKIAGQKAQLILEEGRMEKSSEVLVKGFAEADVHLFPRLEAWMREVKDQIREEIRTQIGL